MEGGFHTEVAEVEYKEEQVPFSETVQPRQGTRITKTFPFDGTITQVMFSFPPGSVGLVDVRLLKDEKPMYPNVGYLALDNASPVYTPNVGYYAKEPLTVEVLNRDGINPHTPTVTVTIRYKKKWWQ